MDVTAKTLSAPVVVAAWLWASSLSAHETTQSDLLVERELIEREIAARIAPIQTAVQLRAYLTRIPTDSPLLSLSQGARQRFLQSLNFTERGLASFQYTDLRAELSASEIYRLLSLFGAQNTTKSIPQLRVSSAADAAVYDQALGEIGPATDYPDRACQRPATCTQRIGDICIGNNCGMIEP